MENQMSARAEQGGDVALPQFNSTDPQERVAMKMMALQQGLAATGSEDLARAIEEEYGARLQGIAEKRDGLVNQLNAQTVIAEQMEGKDVAAGAAGGSFMRALAAAAVTAVGSVAATFGFSRGKDKVNKPGKGDYAKNAAAMAAVGAVASFVSNMVAGSRAAGAAPKLNLPSPEALMGDLAQLDTLQLQTVEAIADRYLPEVQSRYEAMRNNTELKKARASAPATHPDGPVTPSPQTSHSPQDGRPMAGPTPPAAPDKTRDTAAAGVHGQSELIHHKELASSGASVG